MYGLNGLRRVNLIAMGEIELDPTEAGKLMARFYIAFDTMKNFAGKLLFSICDHKLVLSLWQQKIGVCFTVKSRKKSHKMIEQPTCTAFNKKGL